MEVALKQTVLFLLSLCLLCICQSFCGCSRTLRAPSRRSNVYLLLSHYLMPLWWCTMPVRYTAHGMLIQRWDGDMHIWHACMTAQVSWDVWVYFTCIDILALFLIKDNTDKNKSVRLEWKGGFTQLGAQFHLIISVPPASTSWQSKYISALCLLPPRQELHLST